MKVETVVDEHRARYIHPTESSSDPNATGYFHWIFPTGRIHFLDSFWRSVAPSAPPLPLLPSILRQTVAKLLLYRPCLPFSWKANNNAIHPRIIQPVGIPFNFFVSSSLFLPSFALSSFLSPIEANCFDEAARKARSLGIYRSKLFFFLFIKNLN